MDRRNFIRLTSGAAVAGSLLTGCGEKRKIKGSIIGASANIGHLLRHKQFDGPDETAHKKLSLLERE